MNSDEVKMEVNIAGERILLTVPFSRQEAVRKTEGELSLLYKTWGAKFPKKSPKELLAMIAYKFASSYFDLLEERSKDISEAQSMLDALARLCGDSQSDSDSEEYEEFPLY